MHRQLVVALLVLASLAAATGAVAAEATCGQSVTHDFRTDAAIAVWHNESVVKSSEQNTDVRVADDTGFVRVRVKNPNAYCQTVTIYLPSEMVEPADLGTVDALNASTTATWAAIKNFETGSEYTRIRVTVGPGQTVRFAPSEMRVVTLSWTSDAHQRAESVLGTVSGLVSSVGNETDEPAKQTYTINGSAGDRVQVPLTRENGTGRVTDWIAEYRTTGGWTPVTKDSEQPVYYTTADASVTFHFREQATVRFVVTPGPMQRMAYSWHGYTAGWSGLSDLLPF